MSIFEMMKKNNMHFGTTSLILFLLSINIVAADPCKAGNKPVHFVVNRTLQKNLPLDFSQGMYEELESSLSEIGFCLQTMDSTVFKDTTKREELIMYMTTETQLSSNIEEGQNLMICLVQVGDWVKGNIEIALTHPLISISYQPEELSTFRTVLVKKILENIRTQYVCHLRIQSNPSGILITSPVGLEGKTPLEWILPFGNLTIKNKTDGYEPFQKRVDLSEPGIHTYFLELKKKQFYNSKFLVPTIIFALASAASYGGERIYYSKYLNLGKGDYLSNPEKFESTYAKASMYERASLITLACAAVSFTCTFVFR
jgi:hypothetical protein